MKKVYYIFFILITLTKMSGQETELTNNWLAKKASEVKEGGTAITAQDYNPENWLPATVPGTVLTTLINNKLVPDPFFGMNNQRIIDIYDAGRAEYTYWFFNRFRMSAMADESQVWLNFRGLNYFADIYLNGKKVNEKTHEGMFLREKYLITNLVEGEITNRLAVYVEPPDPVGNPNGGQGGDGAVARSVGMQFTAGWNWKQSIADRNTGIWDKVSIEITGPVDIRNPFVKTRVPDIRIPGELQDPAYVTFSAELVNASDKIQKGDLIVQFLTDEKSQKVTLAPNSSTIVTFKEFKINNPRLWWPNGTGIPAMNDAQFYFALDNKLISDNESVSFGIRETSTYFDKELGSRVFLVNGQKIFLKGGNWIASDALLRLSRDRYDAEIKMHAEMNMNTIRVWGGSMTERPEFYDACDKYGILVWQDLGITGEVNARQADDHSLFIESVIDQIKLLRNHPSLYLWSGGAEFPLPDDINRELKDSVFPQYDGTRYYLNESNSEDLMINTTGRSADGPFSIREPSDYFTIKSLSFNPGIGLVGLPNSGSLLKMMDIADLVSPEINKSSSSMAENINPTWIYHGYPGYGNFIERYGAVKDFDDFCLKAQLNNYEQYRALQEGFNANMWNRYSGMLVFKSQNPWTALGGQLYDYFLDQNAGFYGYKHAAQPLHIQLNLNDTVVSIINTIPKERKDLSAKAVIYDIHGKVLSSTIVNLTVKATSVTDTIKLVFPQTGGPLFFVRLTLSNTNTNSILDENIYWISTIKDDYRKLNELAEAEISVMVNRPSNTKATVEIRNKGKETSFFMKGVIKGLESGEQILPVYMDDNYITLFPGERKIIEIDLYNLNMDISSTPMVFEIDGWNLKKMSVSIPPGK